MKLLDLEKMTKVGDIKRMNERMNADGSDATTETYTDNKGRYFQIDRKNKKYREIFEDKSPTDWRSF